MHRLKLNLVKIALTIDDFLPGVTGSQDFALDPLALSRFEEVVTLARKYNVRLMV
jgi:hypothetical protein